MRWHWLVAAVLGLAAAGCCLGLDRVGAGEPCRQDRECVEGQECIVRVCARPPEKSEVDAAIPDPVPDAGDAGDAGDAAP